MSYILKIYNTIRYSSVTHCLLLPFAVYLCLMSVVESLQKCTIASLTSLFNTDFTEKDFQVNQTKQEFEGDYTVVLFSLVKSLKLSPDDIGSKLGNHLI